MLIRWVIAFALGSITTATGIYSFGTPIGLALIDLGERTRRASVQPTFLYEDDSQDAVITRKIDERLTELMGKYLANAPRPKR